MAKVELLDHLAQLYFAFFISPLTEQLVLVGLHLLGNENFTEVVSSAYVHLEPDQVSALSQVASRGSERLLSIGDGVSRLVNELCLLYDHLIRTRVVAELIEGLIDSRIVVLISIRQVTLRHLVGDLLEYEWLLEVVPQHQIGGMCNLLEFRGTFAFVEAG